MLFDHVRDQWNLLSAMFGVWTEEEFLVTCKVLALLLLSIMIIMIFMAVVVVNDGVGNHSCFVILTCAAVGLACGLEPRLCGLLL